MRNSTPRILIIETENNSASVYQTLASQADRFKLKVVDSLEAGQRYLQKSQVDLIIADSTLPDGNSMEFLSANSDRSPLPMLVLVEPGDEHIAVDAIEAGALDYVVKTPTDLQTWLQIINRALRMWERAVQLQQAEKALHQCEERYHLLLNAVTDYVYTVKIKDGRPYATTHGPGCVAVTGHTPQDYEADPNLWIRMVDKKDRQAVVQRTKRIVAGKETAPIEHRIWHKDKSVRWVRNTPILHFGPDGRLIAYDGLISDITERKQIEESLRESEDKFRSIVEQSEDGIVLIDQRGNIVEWNRGQEKITGIPRKRVLNQPFWEIQFQLTPDDERNNPGVYEHTKNRVLKLLKTGNASWLNQLVENEIQLSDGSRRIIQTLVFRIKTDKGNMYGSTSRDITERKQAEETLRMARDQLEERVEERTRTLESTIEQLKQQIEDRKRVEEALKKADEALQQRVTQLALINDISGKIAAVLELNSVLERAARLIQESFDYHHVSLFTIDRPQRELVMRARSGSFADLFPFDHRLKLGQGMVGWVGQSGEKLLANDVSKEPHFVNLYPETIPTKSELSVPLRLGGDVIGVLDVQSPQTLAFDENDVMVIETLADQIAVAIENARLYEEIQRELTRRLRVEEALGESEERYHTLIQTSPIAISLADMSMKIIFCNQQTAEMYGVPSPDQLMGRSMLDLAAPEDRTQIQDDFNQTRPGKILKNQEYTFHKMDGTQFPAEVSASGLLDAEGTPLGFVSAIRDISERKQAEALQSQLAAIVEHSDDAIISKTLDGRIVSWNRGAERMYGYTVDEVKDQSVTLLAPEERIPEVLQILERIKHGEPFIHLESERLRKDGKRIDVSLTISPIKDVTGKVTGTSTIARDITERKKMEAYILRTERLAAMGHIAAVLAHEVKNLLQAVQSNLDVVLEYPLDPDEREEYLVMCSQELDRLAVITNRVLNLASPKRSIYNMMLVKDLLNRVLTLVDKPLQLAHIQIAMDVPEKLVAELDVPDQILEVLLNLIINSIEAMPEGGLIYITADADQEHIRLILRNNGPAIPVESLPHLFDPFFTTKPEGTGLGLSISHSIIQNYGGKITAENLPDGIGIEFVIELPRLNFEIAEDPAHG